MKCMLTTLGIKQHFYNAYKYGLKSVLFVLVCFPMMSDATVAQQVPHCSGLQRYSGECDRVLGQITLYYVPEKSNSIFFVFV